MPKPKLPAGPPPVGGVAATVEVDWSSKTEGKRADAAIDWPKGEEPPPPPTAPPPPRQLSHVVALLPGAA